MDLRFKDLKKYISRIDRISICMQEDLSYENYPDMSKVPDKYDERYVYGIGLRASEFSPDDRMTEAAKAPGEKIWNRFILEQCIEIMLSEKPRPEYQEVTEPDIW